MSGLEQKLDDFFLNKMPKLPADRKETVANVLPWIMIVFGGVGFLAWLSSLRFFFGFAGYMQHGAGYGFPDVFTLIYLVIAPIVQAMAVYGGYLMLSRQRKGWCIALYALLIGFIPHIFSFSILGICLDVVFAYLLFQIKEYYGEKTVV
jgi:small-conductance mechanosensitive channel